MFNPLGIAGFPFHHPILVIPHPGFQISVYFQMHCWDAMGDTVVEWIVGESGCREEREELSSCDLF